MIIKNEGDKAVCNEYIINVKTLSGSEVYKIYHHNEPLATKRFLKLCEGYARTGKDDAKAYWRELIFSVENGRYTIFQNFDFTGVVKVI